MAIRLTLALAAIVAIVSAARPSLAAPPGPPVQTTANGGTEESRVRAYLRLPVTYTILRGSEFDGRAAHVFDATRTAYLPRIAGGFGTKPSVGIAFNRVLPWLGLMTGLSFGYSRHQAISYNIGNTWYEHDDAKFFQAELELRGLLELGAFKPFVGVTPGMSFLLLPNGITEVNADHVVSWSDLTLKGFSIEEQLGLLYQMLPFLALDASLGFRLQRLTSSSRGSLSGFGFSSGWLASLGAIASF